MIFLLQLNYKKSNKIAILKNKKLSNFCGLSTKSFKKTMYKKIFSKIEKNFLI